MFLPPLPPYDHSLDPKPEKIPVVRFLSYDRPAPDDCKNFNELTADELMIVKSYVENQKYWKNKV